MSDVPVPVHLIKHLIDTVEKSLKGEKPKVPEMTLKKLRNLIASVDDNTVVDRKDDRNITLSQYIVDRS
jgi:hypothetical protein